MLLSELVTEALVGRDHIEVTQKAQGISRSVAATTDM